MLMLNPKTLYPAPVAPRAKGQLREGLSYVFAKPTILWTVVMVAFVAVFALNMPVLLAAWVMQMIAAPVASHLISRTGYRTKHMRRDLLHRDDLAAQARRVPREPLPAIMPDVEGHGPLGDQEER